MSRENVEVVRRIYAKWEQGDFAAAVEWFDPEITFETFMPDASEFVTAHGLDELASFTRTFFGQWQRYRIIGDEFQAIGADKVLVSGRQAAAGKHSGAEVESPAFIVWTLRAGTVVKLTFHYDRESALEAAGLRA